MAAVVMYQRRSRGLFLRVNRFEAAVLVYLAAAAAFWVVMVLLVLRLL